jgi:hypothetical protein
MASRTVPRLLISRSLDALGCDPTAASPAALGRILLYVLPSTLAAPDRYGNLIPPVARAWMEWLMDRRALDKPARRQIKRQLDATLRRFPAAWNGPLQSPMLGLSCRVAARLVTAGVMVERRGNLDAAAPVRRRRTRAAKGSFAAHMRSGGRRYHAW